MPAEEGAAWTIRYPRFNLVVPSPTLIVPFGYAVQPGDSELLTFMNAWFLNAKGNGTVDTLYRYWMLGEVRQIKPPAGPWSGTCRAGSISPAPNRSMNADLPIALLPPLEHPPAPRAAGAGYHVPLVRVRACLRAPNRRLETR